MQHKIFTTIIATSILLSYAACAQSKKSNIPKSGTSYARLLECAEQTTLPGRQESEPITQKRIVIIWKSKYKPETFFWRGEDGWTDCNIQKVHTRHGKVQPKYEFGENWYDTETISLDKIKNGDTLELTPFYGGKNPIPKEISNKHANKIFFKSKSTTWLYLSVNKCIIRPNIVMP